MNQVVRYRMDDGTRPAIVCGRTPRFLRVVYLGSTGVRLSRVDAAEERFMTPLAGRFGKPYPPKKAARSMLSAGRKLGISKTARKALRSVVTAR